MSHLPRLGGFVARRTLSAVPTLLLVAVFVFALIRMLPGDPAQVMLGDSADPATLADLHHHMGFDRPVPLQFLVWFGHALEGDLGTSISTGEPVLALILERFQVTAAVVLVAVAIATLLATIAGMLAAWRQNQMIDLIVVAASTLGLAVPSFWLGLLLLLVLAVDLQWFPVIGYVSPREDFGGWLIYMILPVVTLVATETGVLTRTMRASAIEVLSHDYITHARAKGASERRLLWRHVLPNAFAPVLTMVGLILGHLLGGAAVIETVFTLPGIGRLMVDSILSRDYPVVQGCLLFTAVIYVVINLIVDLCYSVLDPRVAGST